MVEVQVAHLGLHQATNSPVVVLREKDGERVLPIWIGAPEANAIAMEINGIKAERPLTHDLLKQVLTGLGGELRRVIISSVRDKTYFAELLILRNEQLFEVDARPSDSIALALKLQAPILCDELLLQSDDGGPPVPPPGTPDPEGLKRYLEGLDPQDFGKFSL